MYINKTIQKLSTNNTKHNIYNFTHLRHVVRNYFHHAYFASYWKGMFFVHVNVRNTRPTTDANFSSRLAVTKLISVPRFIFPAVRT